MAEQNAYERAQEIQRLRAQIQQSENQSAGTPDPKTGLVNVKPNWSINLPRDKQTLINPNMAGQFKQPYIHDLGPWNAPVQQQKPKMPTYWNDAQRIGRYYHAIQSLPPDVELPTWVDRVGIEAAYQYLSETRKDQHWSDWDNIPDDDPLNMITSQMQIPPPGIMPVWEQQRLATQYEYMNRYNDWLTGGMQDQPPYTPDPGAREVGDLGMPADTWAELPEWKQAANRLLPVIQYGLPALGGAMIGGWLGLPGAVVGAATMLGGTVMAGKIQQKIDAGMEITWSEKVLMNVFKTLNWPAETLEKLGGLEAQIVSSILHPDKYGPVHELFGDWENFFAFSKLDPEIIKAIDADGTILEGLLQAGYGFAKGPEYILGGGYKEMLKNLPATYAAGSLLYESALSSHQLIDGRDVQEEIKTFDGSLNEYLSTWAGSPGEKEARRFIIGHDISSVNDIITEVPEGMTPTPWVMQEFRKRVIENGESPNDVFLSLGNQFGFMGSMRELGGNVLLDPLDWFGGIVNAGLWNYGTVKGNKAMVQAFGGITPERPGPFGRITEDLISNSKLYGQLIRSMPPEQAAQMSAVSRWIAGLNKEGMPKDLTAKPKKNMINYLFGLTPKSRANAVLSNFMNGLYDLMSMDTDRKTMEGLLDKISTLKPEDAVNGADGATIKLMVGGEMTDAKVPSWFMSSEAQMLPSAMRDGMSKVKSELEAFDAAAPQRMIIQRIADYMGLQPEDFIATLKKATPQEADRLYANFILRLKDVSGKGDPGAKKLLETLVNVPENKGLNGTKLKQMADHFFGPKGVPFNEGILKFRILDVLENHISKWAVDWFGVKPDNGLLRFGNLIKRAQSALLLGFNPSYFFNNTINNLVTMSWDGLIKLGQKYKEQAYMQDFGIIPTRMAQGAGAMDFGEVGAGMLKMFEMEPKDIGIPIRNASRSNDWIQKIDDVLKVGDKIQVFAVLSQAMEKWSSRKAVVTGIQEFMAHGWQPGIGFDKVPNELKMVLENYEPGMSKRLEKIISSNISKEKLEKAIWGEFGPPTTIKEVLTPDEITALEGIGLLDEIDTRLAKAKTKDDIYDAFHEVRKLFQKKLSEQITRNMTKMVNDAAMKAGMEGTQGVLDLIDNLMRMRSDFWLKHFEFMASVAEDAAGKKGDARWFVWYNGSVQARTNWNGFNNIEGAKTLGIFRGLGLDENDPRYADVFDNVVRQHNAWDSFYEGAQELYDRYYALTSLLDDNNERTRLWNETNENINNLYLKAALDEDDIVTEFDDMFIDQYARQFESRGETAVKEAETWRNAIKQERRKMMQAQILYRTGAIPQEMLVWGDLIPADIKKAMFDLTGNNPVHTFNRATRDKIAPKFFGEIYTQFIRDINKVSSETAPGMPIDKTLIPDVEPAPVDTTPPPAPGAGQQTASIPVMITKKMRSDLKDLGYTAADVRTMTPEDAWNLINNQTKKVVTEGTVTKPRATNDQDAEIWKTIAEQKPDLAGVSDEGVINDQARLNIIKYVLKYNKEDMIKKMLYDPNTKKKTLHWQNITPEDITKAVALEKQHNESQTLTPDSTPTQESEATRPLTDQEVAEYEVSIDDFKKRTEEIHTEQKTVETQRQRFENMLKVRDQLEKNMTEMQRKLEEIKIGKEAAERTLQEFLEIRGQSALYEPIRKIWEGISQNYAKNFPGKTAEDWYETYFFDKDGLFGVDDIENLPQIPPSSVEFQDWNTYDWVNDRLGSKPSVVVDQEGKPLVVFHGTDKEFEVAQGGSGSLDRALGSHFAESPEVASRFALGLMRDKKSGYHDPTGGNIMPSYLSIQNPRIIEPTNGRFDTWLLRKDMVELVFPKNKELFLEWFDESFAGSGSRELGSEIFDRLVIGEGVPVDEFGSYFGLDKPNITIGDYVMDRYGFAFERNNVDKLADLYKAELRAQGFDGIKYMNTAPMETSDITMQFAPLRDPLWNKPIEMKFNAVENKTTWIPLSSEQAKSVFNYGPFSPHDPRMLYQEAVTTRIYVPEAMHNYARMLLRQDDKEILSALWIADSKEEKLQILTALNKQDPERARSIFEQAKQKKGYLWQDKPQMWTHKAKQVIEMHMPETATTDKVRNLLQANVNKEELKWLGLDDWLESHKGRVTRDQVIEFIQNNSVEINEKILGFDPTPDNSKRVQLINDLRAEYDVTENLYIKEKLKITNRALRDPDFKVEYPDVDFIKLANMKEDTYIAIMQSKYGEQFTANFRKYSADLNTITGKINRLKSGFKKAETKYENYTMPGGDQYTELLITWPMKNIKIPRGVDDLQGFLNNELTGLSYQRRELDTFKKSHWRDVDNVMLSVRMKERTINGKKILSLEEIQSDWHEQGFGKGYKILDDLKNEYKMLNSQIADLATENPKINELDTRIDTLIEKRSNIDYGNTEESVSLGRKRYRDISKEISRLEIERLDLMKTLPGLEKINARRKELDKLIAQGGGVPDAPFKDNWYQVGLKRAIRWAAENGYDQVMITGPSVHIDRYNLANKYDQLDWHYAFDTDRYGVSGKNKVGHYQELVKSASADELKTALNSEIAKRIIAQQKQSNSRFGSLSGPEELAVSDTFFKEFYGKKIPNWLNKYLKQWGAEVKPGKLDNYDVFAFDVSTEMRKSAMQEQFTLWQKKRGATSWVKNGMAILHAFEGGDFTTVLHETVHIYTPQMSKPHSDVIRTWLKQEYGMDVPENWHLDPVLHSDASEKLAYGFERYVYEGIAPIPRLKQVFEDLKSWMLQIYKSVTGSPIDIRLNDNIRKVFDEWVTAEKAVEQITSNYGPIKDSQIRGRSVAVIPIVKTMPSSQFKDHLIAVRKYGGWYDQNQKAFVFNNAEAADNFLKDFGGRADETAVIKPAPEAIKAVDTDVENVDEVAFRTKKDNQARKLMEAADKLEGKSQEDYSSNRLENTARRARQAESSRAAANQNIFIARTMRNIAQAIIDGDSIHLGGVTAKTHVELLNTLLQRAKYDFDYNRSKNHSFVARYEDSAARRPTLEDLDFVEYPYVIMRGSFIQDMINKVKGKKGIKDDVDAIRRFLGSDYKKTTDPKVIESYVKVKKMAGGKDNWTDNLEDYNRIKKMGIDNKEQLIAAMREFMNVLGEGHKPDKIKDLERDLIGTQIPGYFPTPREVAKELVMEAHIEPGMKVLEPSAGKGNIADVIREFNPDAELSVVEINSTLRKILQEKGYNLVGDDIFTVQGTFDRIVMNPPFEKFQDIDHVMRAYDMLNPGGTIVSIMGAGVFFRNDAKAVEFRAWLDDHGVYQPLPEGSFLKSERSTGVNAYKVMIEKPKNAPNPVIQRPDIDVPKAAADIVDEPYKWKYEEYNQWSRSMAETNAKKSLENRLAAIEKELEKATESHLGTLQRTTSMQSNSQARAQAGNVVAGLGDEKMAIKNALEIYEFYPEHTLEGRVAKNNADHFSKMATKFKEQYPDNPWEKSFEEYSEWYRANKNKMANEVLIRREHNRLKDAAREYGLMPELTVEELASMDIREYPDAEKLLLTEKDPKIAQARNNKPGVTREQVERADKRKLAIYQAQNNKYKSGPKNVVTISKFMGDATIGEVMDGYLAGGWKLEQVKRGAIMRDGLAKDHETMVLDKIAADYVKTVLNEGQFAKNWDDAMFTKAQEPAATQAPETKVIPGSENLPPADSDEFKAQVKNDLTAKIKLEPKAVEFAKTPEGQRIVDLAWKRGIEDVEYEYNSALASGDPHLTEARRIRLENYKNRIPDDSMIIRMESMLNNPDTPGIKHALETTPEPEAPVTYEPKPANLIGFSENDVDYQAAYRAHTGTSWDPEKRAKYIQKEYFDHMQAVHDHYMKYATSPEMAEQITAALLRYKEGYLKRLNEYLHSRNGLVSSMIAGPSNFPVARMRKKSDSVDAKSAALLEWSQKAQAAMDKQFNPNTKGPIAAGDPDALVKLQTKLDKAQELQKIMVESNKIVRSKTLDTAEKIIKLQEVANISEATARKLLDGDYIGRKGFADYQLQNNNAEINRLKNRIESISVMKEKTPDKWVFDGGTVEENTEIARLQIFFDSKPSAEMRDKLKKRGFRWAPSENAWQRQLTNNARYDITNILPDLKKVEAEAPAPQVADLADEVFIEPKFKVEEPEGPAPQATPEVYPGAEIDGEVYDVGSQVMDQWIEQTFDGFMPLKRYKIVLTKGDKTRFIYVYKKNRSKDFYFDTPALQRIVNPDGSPTDMPSSIIVKVNRFTDNMKFIEEVSTYKISRDEYIQHMQDYPPNPEQAARIKEYIENKAKEPDPITPAPESIAQPQAENVWEPRQMEEYEGYIYYIGKNDANLYRAPINAPRDADGYPKGVLDAQFYHAGERLEQIRKAKQLQAQSTRQPGEPWKPIHPYEKTFQQFFDEDTTHMPGDKYQVEKAGRTYKEEATKVYANGTVLIDLFGLKMLEPGEYVHLKSKQARIDAHKKHIQNAIMTGQEIPHEVLAEYPDLQYMKADLNKSQKKEPPRFKEKVPKIGYSRDEVLYIMGQINGHIDHSTFLTGLRNQLAKEPDDFVLKLEEFQPANKTFEELAEKELRKSVVVEVPDGPKLTFTTPAQLLNYYRRVTGKAPEGFEKVKFTGTSQLSTPSQRPGALGDMYQVLYTYGTFERAKTKLTEQLERMRDEPGYDANKAEKLLAEIDKWIDESKETEAQKKARERRARGYLSQDAATPEQPAQAPEPQQPVAQNAPHGTFEQVAEPPYDEMLYEGWMNTVGPMLDSAQHKLMDMKKPEAKSIGGSLPPDQQKMLRKYLGGVYSDLASTKMGAIGHGLSRRDFALLNYANRTGFDSVMGFVMPYQFWYTRSALNWLGRLITNPKIFADYLRLTMFAQSAEDREGYPTRLRGKFGIKMPFLPDGMGKTVYVDPFKQIYPFQQLAAPFRRMAEENNLVNRKAAGYVQQQLEDGKITDQQAREALSTMKGDVWEEAIIQAKTDAETQFNNPLDVAFALASPSLPLSIAYNFSPLGDKDRISQLPITRTFQTMTSMLGIGGPRGVNVEGPLRKGLGLPEVDKYEEYRINRELSNMVADGLIEKDDAIMAMINRQGPDFLEAQKRVAKQMNTRTFFSSIGLDFFPEGEQEMRSIANEYSKALEAQYEKGQTDALAKFYDEFPEYEARTAIMKEPEELLRAFLRSNVWAAYNEMNSFEKAQVRDSFGDLFSQSFINKETRNYDGINTETLATWAKTLGREMPDQYANAAEIPGATIPQEANQLLDQYLQDREAKFPGIAELLNQLYSLDPDSQAIFRKSNPQINDYQAWRNRYIAEHPAISEYVTGDQSELYGLPQHVQVAVYQYRADVDQYFPDIYDTQGKYFEITNSNQKKAYLRAHPELTAYWDYRREYAAAFPQAAPYILSDESLAKSILGETRSVSMNKEIPVPTPQDVDPALLRLLASYFYGGRPLTSGAQTELARLWKKAGSPAGSMENWLHAYVWPNLKK